jgi:PTS system beta-glucosides-specific IIC component
MLEHWIEPKLPDVIKAIGTPFICAAVMVPLTIVVIGPISTVIANALSNGYNMLYNAVPWLASGVLAFFWQVFVIFGVHWSFTPVSLANYANLGFDVMQVCMQIAVCAQTAACFGVFIKSRNSQVKNVSASAAATGLFGITEPAIYGVTLRFKKPFFCGCIGAAIGGIVSSFFGSRYFVYAGLSGFLTIPNAIYDSAAQANCEAAGTATESFAGGIYGVLIGTVVACVSAFILVQIVGFDDPVEIPPEAMEDTPDAVATDAGLADTTIYAPMNGELMELSTVPDETFAGGVLGQGIAIVPSEGKLYSPVDGVVTNVFDTKHAICLQTPSGAEMIIHIGLETVSLGGKHFEAKVSTDQQVKKGDLLIEFDLDEIKKEFKTCTPVLITNADDYASIDIPKTSGKVKVGDPIYTAKA